MMEKSKMRYILIETIYRVIAKSSSTPGQLSGWYAQLEGSGELFYISDTEPDFKAGDKVKITLEKI